MKHRNWLRIAVLASMATVLNFCSVNPLTPDIDGDMSLVNGTPLDQITWAKWNPEALAVLESEADNALARRSRGYASKNIYNDEGGTVGGSKTFGNKVVVPEDAFEENKLKISVRVLNHNRSEQTAAGVEFLPSRHYDADMFITLSWEFLDVEDDDWENLNLQPFFSEDEGATWFAVEDYTVDPEGKTINFAIDHFTQYGWGLGEDEDY